MLMLNVGKRRHIGVSVCTNNPCETRLWVSGRSKRLRQIFLLLALDDVKESGYL